MKFLKIFLTGALIFLTFKTGQANPIVPIFFNELKFDSSSWVIEVRDPWALDSFLLTSLSDSAYFKPGLTSAEYQLISVNDLQSPLYINPQGDILSLYDPNGFILFEQIRFGNVADSQIAAPLPGQSICLKETPDHFIDFYYLDNTPTPGQSNDTLNARGTVQGQASNQFGAPVGGVTVIWSNGSTYTNSSGYFIFADYARLEPLEFFKTNYQTQSLNVQIWPEDTVTIDITLDSIIAALPLEADDGIAGFELKQNYPNPFNPLTSIEFTLPARSRVSLTIYNLAGETVSVPVSGELSPGIYRVQWDGSKMASGIYFYRLQAVPQWSEENLRGIFTTTQKMILFK